jgi:hypothetical protein
MRVAAFDGCDKDMLKPAHTSANRELVLHKGVVEHLPAPTIDAVVCESSLASHSDISAIIRDNCASNGPLIDQVMWRYLHVMPK